MKETDIKYLAGLLDADGSFYFNFTNGYVYLTISLDLSTGIDKEMHYTNWLCEQVKVKPQVYKRDLSAKGISSIKIVISKRSEIEKLVPRLMKYLVIKGKHLDRLYYKWRKIKGIKHTEDQITDLKEFVKESRKDSGPLSNKEWLPKAYVAGFLDGDGCYQMKKSSGSYNVSTISHKDDYQVAHLLKKQYGGKIYYQEDWIRWRHPLGRSNKSFAIKFLRDMHKHSRLKKWKIEQFLNYHSQRLTEESPKGQVIV